MQDAPALRPEGYITTMKDYMAKIKFQLSEVHYPDGRTERMMTTWKVFQQDLDHAAGFGEQYLKKGNYKRLADALLPQVQQLGNETEKLHHIYKHLVTNLKWSGGYSMFTRGAKLDDIFDSKECSSAELNMMLYVLLKEAGISAHLVLVSTRGHGKMYEDYPILDQFNHLLVMAMPDGNRIFLDATDPFRPPGYPAVQALNSRALLLAPQGTPSWINLPAPADAASIYNYELAIEPDGTLTGMFKAAHKGYSAVAESHAQREGPGGKKWRERLIKKYPDAEILTTSTSEISYKDASLFDTVNLRIPNAGQGGSGFLYLSPLLHSDFDENIFKAKERYYPVDVPYPITEYHNVKLSLPEGFAVEALPEPANFSLPANGGMFRFAAEEKTPGQIDIMARLNVKQLRFTPEEYPNLKEMFDLVVQKFGEQIVLKAID